MPGYVMHLALAKKLLPELIKLPEINISTNEDICDFYIGSVIPDIKAGSDKKETHFWNEETLTKFLRKPIMENVVKSFEDILDNPFALGYYIHLYFDFYFVDTFWKKHYKFYNENKIESELLDIKYVEIIKEGRLFDRATFFSDEYFYGDYSRMVPYVASKYNIPVIDLGKMFDETIARLKNKIDTDKKDTEKSQKLDKICKLYNMVMKNADCDSVKKFNIMIQQVNAYMENDSKDFCYNNQLKVFKYEEIDGMIDDVACKILSNKSFLAHAK